MPSFTSRHCDCCNVGVGRVRAAQTRLYQKTLQMLSRHCAWRSTEAELHQPLLQLFVSLALVVSSVMGQEDTASPEDPSTSDSVVVLCFAIPRGRAASAQKPARFLTCSWRSRAWSCAKAQPGRQQFHPYRHGGTKLHWSLFTSCSGSPPMLKHRLPRAFDCFAGRSHPFCRSRAICFARSPEAFTPPPWLSSLSAASPRPCRDSLERCLLELPLA